MTTVLILKDTAVHW